MDWVRRFTSQRGVRTGGLAAFLASMVLILTAASLVGCGSERTKETQPQVTDTTSAGGSGKLDFSGKTLAGADVSLGGYRGKPLVLAFMASW